MTFLKNEKLMIEGVCITASGNILASGKISRNLFMAPLEIIELLIFWHILVEQLCFKNQ